MIETPFLWDVLESNPFIFLHYISLQLLINSAISSFIGRIQMNVKELI